MVGKNCGAARGPSGSKLYVNTCIGPWLLPAKKRKRIQSLNFQQLVKTLLAIEL
jgi:hypothetical protein